MNRIYFDHSATTPIIKPVLDTITPLLQNFTANPSAIYQEAQSSRAKLQSYRRQAAVFLGVDTDEIYFTSGASESNSMAIVGVCLARRSERDVLLLGTTIHDSISKTAKHLAEVHDFNVITLPNDSTGAIDIDAARQYFTNKVAMLAVGYACSDIGTCQPLDGISQLCQEKNIALHVDCTQAPGYFDLDPRKFYLTSLALTGHKIYGPKGVGLLYLKQEQPLVALIHGGSQENGLRAGTENIASIAGLCKALELTKDKSSYDRIVGLTANLKDRLQTNFKQLIFTGDQNNRLPFHISLIVQGIDAQQLLLKLDLAGVAASAGSACNIGKNEPLAALIRLGYSQKQANSGLRLSLGRLNQENDLDNFIEIMNSILNK